MTNRVKAGIGAGAVAFVLVAIWLAVRATPPGPPDGRLPGYFAVATLIALIGYSFLAVSRPLVEDDSSSFVWALLLLLAIFMIKIIALPLLPGLGIDVGLYQSWAQRIVEVGPARTYQEGVFLDYPPGYLYALWGAGAFVNALKLT